MKKITFFLIVTFYLCGLSSAIGKNLIARSQKIIVVPVGTGTKAENRTFSTNAVGYPVQVGGLEAFGFFQTGEKVIAKSYSSTIAGETIDIVAPTSLDTKLVYVSVWVKGYFSEILTYLILYVDDKTAPARVILKGESNSITCEVVNAWGDPLSGIAVEKVRLDYSKESATTDASGIATFSLNELKDSGFLKFQVVSIQYVYGNGEGFSSNGVFTFFPF